MLSTESDLQRFSIGEKPGRKVQNFHDFPDFPEKFCERRFKIPDSTNDDFPDDVGPLIVKILFFFNISSADSTSLSLAKKKSESFFV